MTRRRPLVFLGIGIAIALVVAIFLFAVLRPVTPTSNNALPHVGGKAPSYQLPVLGEKTKRSTPSQNSNNQKGVILLFFASWCAPCRGEMPKLESAFLANTSVFSRIEVIGIDGDNSISDGKHFVAKNKLSFPIVDDATFHLTQETYGFLGDPDAVFIQSDGVISEIDQGTISAHQLVSGAQKLITQNGTSS